ncbi:hypothetical protein R1flu_016932 [Riccia fluitans]|uniref:Uncharacterized protein n=1 Tax=Riccia fluitans TaxID=41844 RepID=A0ABD1YN97_9MARC
MVPVRYSRVLGLYRNIEGMAFKLLIPFRTPQVLFIKSQSSELFRASSSNLFPNLGSANVCTVPEEFTFPESRKRADESWREQRGFRRDWAPTVENNVRESTTMADSFGKKLADETSSSKLPSFCTVAFLYPPCLCTTSASGSASRVNSLSEFYCKSPTGKCKSSPTTSSGPADAIPKNVNSSGLQQAGLECRAEEGGAEKIQLEKASGEEYREKVATQEANEDFYLQGSYNRSNSRL